MPRILVVDDDFQVLKMLRAMLAGHDVVAVQSGRKGLETLREQKIDGVIIDMLMPDMDGLEMIRRILSEHPDMKIIALSGGGPFGRLDLLERAIELGARQSLQKPVDWEELTTAVASLFEGESAAG